MDVKQKFLTKICAILVIISLVLSDFLFVGTNLVSYALDSKTTNSQNVDFSAYFLDENSQKVDRIQKSTNEGENKLYIEVSVKKEGDFNGQINLENGNFKLKQENRNEYIKSISETSIILNQIDAGRNVSLELEIEPVNNNEILNTKTDILISGNYRDSKNAEKQKSIEIQGKKTLELQWKSSSETKALLGLNLLTNSTYKVNGEEKRIVQVLVDSKITENNYPVKNTEVVLSVPENVADVKVHARSTSATNSNIDFDASNYSYNKEDKTISFKISNEDQKNISWNKNVQDTFVITYIFDIQENVFNKEIIAKSTINTYDNKTLSASKNVHIDKIIDGIVSNKIETEEDAIFKGKIYTGQEREYTVKNTVNIDYIDDENLSIKENTANYKIDNSKSIANINYKQTRINKQEFLKIFGQEGYLTIKSETGAVLANINKDSNTNENGNIEVNYSIPTTSIEIITSKPETVGKLNIEHTKYIQNSTYAREDIDRFTAIEESSTIKGVETTKTIILKDTESVATINLKDTSKISTMADSQTLELEAVLNTSDESKDVFKNPSLTITIPKEITIVSSKYNVLFTNGLEVEKTKISRNENNENQIEFKFKGEQTTYDSTEGTLLNIVLNIKTDILTPSKSSTIKMEYTNENKNQTKTVDTNIEFESQFGLMIYNQALNYNAAKDTVFTVNNDPAYGSIDTNSSAKLATFNTAVINNYGTAIQNVVLVGTIPLTNSQDTYKTMLNKVETDNSNAKISYSANGDAQANDNSWGEYTEDAVKFKIELPQMEKEETIKIKTNITIPEKIAYNKKGIFELDANCSYLGKNEQKSSNIILATAANITENTSNITENNDNSEKKLIQTTTIAGNDVLEDNDNIYGGQVLKYKVLITNNTGKDYTNVTVKAKQKNGYVWDHVEKSVENPHYNKTIDVHYYEMTDSNNITLGKIESFKNGESYTFEYEATAYLLNNEKIEGTTTYGTIGVISEDKQLSKTETTIKNNIKESELQIKLDQGYEDEIKITSGGAVKSVLSIKNTTNTALKDVDVKIAFSNNLTANVSIGEENSTKVSYQGQEENDNGLKIANLKLLNIDANETINIDLNPYTNSLLENKATTVGILAQATTPNKNTYVSNKFTRKVYENSNNIKISQQGLYENGEQIDTEKAKLNNGEKIQLVATIENNENKDVDVNIEYNLDRKLDIQSAKIISSSGEEKDVTEKISYNNVRENEQKLKSGEKITVAMVGTVDAMEIESLTNKLNIYDNSNGKTSNNDLVIGVNTLHQPVEEQEDTETPKEADVPNVPQNPDEDNPTDSSADTAQGATENPTNSNVNNGNTGSSNKEQQDTKKYTVSGTAWIDLNKDGRKNSTEEKIKDVTIEAISLSKGKVLASTKTDSNGEYKFTLEEGKYVLVFNYNNELYTTTTYKANGVNENENSDAIERNVTFNGTTNKAGITDTITLNSNLANLDIGLALRNTFDLKLQKYISKITVTNKAGTKTYEQPANTTLAKAEIKAKNLSGSLVVIEYKIKITNVGDVPGYAKNIVDNMPSSLSFNSSMNSDWYLSGEKLYNTSLANVKIEPNETKELTLVLTKKMTDSNTGLINNKAQIKESSNLLGISDEKDDVGSADVIISVTTGALVSYVISTITTFIVLASIAYFINKKYLSKRI